MCGDCTFVVLVVMYIITRLASDIKVTSWLCQSEVSSNVGLFRNFWLFIIKKQSRIK